MAPIRHTVLVKLKEKESVQHVAEQLLTLQTGLEGVTWLSFNVVTDLGSSRSLMLFS
jgi:hypothetical protein